MAPIKHGLCGSRLYATWSNMKARCHNPRNRDFPDYGGRGIKVCTAWKDSFSEFSRWAFETGYTDELTIERKDINDGYHPVNCTWIPLKEQAHNKQDTVYITIDGVTKSAIEWCKEYSIDLKRFYGRLGIGWSAKDALTTPKNGHYKRDPHLNMATYKDRTQSLLDWCKELGLDYIRVGKRFYRDWSVERMFEQPIVSRK